MSQATTVARRMRVRIEGESSNYCCKTNEREMGGQATTVARLKHDVEGRGQGIEIVGANRSSLQSRFINISSSAFTVSVCRT